LKSDWCLPQTATRFCLREDDVTQKASTAEAVGRYRWVVCALLFFATTVNYIDRQILALIKEFLDQELGWTNEQFGMVNSAFQGAYAVGLLGFGWFIDKYGTKIGYALSIILWSIAAMSHAMVGSIRGFFSARVFLGVSEGGNFPAAIKAVALWFPKSERAFATAIFNAGTNAGALIAPAIIPWIAITFGWRWAFILAGVAGFLWLFFWFPMYDEPDKRKGLSRAELDYILSDREEQNQAGGRSLGWIQSLRYRQTWSFVTAKFLTDPVWWFYLTWLPDYFKATRGLNIKKSWIHIVTIYSIVTVLSIAGGWVTGYLSKRGWTVTRARKTGMFLFALCVIPILTVTKVGDWPAVLLIGLAASAHQAWSANLYTTVSDMFPKRAVASVVGIGGMAGAIGGVVFPWATGRLLDRFHAQGDVTAGYGILFAICASAYVIAFVIHHILAPKFEPFDLEK
jgi:MFS transporter, ACS family, hexuronate transporter